MLLVTLDFWVFQFAANQVFGVRNSVFRVRMESVLGSVTDTTRMDYTVSNVVSNVARRLTDKRKD